MSKGQDDLLEKLVPWHGPVVCSTCQTETSDEGWLVVEIYSERPEWSEGLATGIPEDHGSAFCSWRCLAEWAASCADL